MMTTALALLICGYIVARMVEMITAPSSRAPVRIAGVVLIVGAAVVAGLTLRSAASPADRAIADRPRTLFDEAVHCREVLFTEPAASEPDTITADMRKCGAMLVSRNRDTAAAVAAVRRLYSSGPASAP